MFMKLISSAAFAAALFASSATLAHDDHSHDHKDHAAKHENLKISAAWARATVKTAKVGAGYLTIKNTGSEADRLLSVSADFAGRSEVHEMTLVDDVMRMRPLSDGVEIPAGAEITLKPGAEHLMFMGLKRQLVKGEKIAATLVFQKAGEVKIDLDVKAAGAKAHSEHSDHADHGKKKKHEDHNHDHSHDHNHN